MKSSILKFIAPVLVFVLFANSAVFANKNGKGESSKKKSKKVEAKMVYQSSIHQHKDDLVAVHFIKPSDSKVTISIKDSAGKVLHQETVKKHDQVVKKYLLNKFPKGSYTVTIQNGNEKTVKEIVLD